MMASEYGKMGVYVMWLDVCKPRLESWGAGGLDEEKIGPLNIVFRSGIFPE
jgi:hypothetical protein